MSHTATLDTVLASLARPFQRRADTLLDLRECACDESRVGTCVKAYFDLHEDAPDQREARTGLNGFRHWLEDHVEIAVLDGKSSVCLETWPLTLAGETDLEAFCQKAMNRLREDRCHRASVIHLEFRFRPALAA
ncbi:hypothetical protein [Luteolibacter sp. LG18]|uniref:hypothetical protein n=1 Tax=Luteolibacter sp. LG18 TaxID=2819286 RepID=UPI002B316745|nr:hypothetical protein llg_28830 [Luteolibacter sp. LG18]